MNLDSEIDTFFTKQNRFGQNQKMIYSVQLKTRTQYQIQKQLRKLSEIE